MALRSSVRRFVLDRLYPIALDGLPVLGTPRELAAETAALPGTLDNHVDNVVRRHLALSGAAGFVGGLGGWLTLPVTLPVNLASVALVQLHMAATIAALAGRDPAAPAVREEVLACLVGILPSDGSRTADDEAVDRVGLKIAERGVQTVVALMTGAASWGAQKATERVVRRRLLRGVPLVGGAIGAATDAYVTWQVAAAARDAFIGGLPEPVAPDFPPSSGDGLPDGVPAPTPAAPRAA